MKKDRMDVLNLNAKIPHYQKHMYKSTRPQSAVIKNKDQFEDDKVIRFPAINKDHALDGKICDEHVIKKMEINKEFLKKYRSGLLDNKRPQSQYLSRDPSKDGLKKKVLELNSGSSKKEDLVYDVPRNTKAMNILKFKAGL